MNHLPRPIDIDPHDWVRHQELSLFDLETYPKFRELHNRVLTEYEALPDASVPRNQVEEWAFGFSKALCDYHDFLEDHGIRTPEDDEEVGEATQGALERVLPLATSSWLADHPHLLRWHAKDILKQDRERAAEAVRREEEDEARAGAGPLIRLRSTPAQDLPAYRALVAARDGRLITMTEYIDRRRALLEADLLDYPGDDPFGRTPPPSYPGSGRDGQNA
ncbi:hypothetical protein BC834DRAFT_895902 [Gloeopeniophorella convolvens]|nr:hypothetical protein BC834DRAFT_895902 [Gloeopeniophorella convolvens]